MKLIRKDLRPIISLDEYRGECNNCRNPVELLEKFLVIPLYRTEQTMTVAPAEWLECPHCHTILSLIHITGDHLFQTKLTPPTTKGLN